MSESTNNLVWRDGIAVITGAVSGIGEALARYAACEPGMKVVLAMPIDVADSASTSTLAAKAYSHFGDATLLINNAVDGHR